MKGKRIILIALGAAALGFTGVVCAMAAHMAHMPAYTASATSSQAVSAVSGAAQTAISTTTLADFFKSSPKQLVTRVGYAKNIPSPKSLTFTPDGKEIWVASLMNEKSGLTVFDVSFMNAELTNKVNASMGAMAAAGNNAKNAATVSTSTIAKRIADIVLPGGGAVEVIFSKDSSKAYVSQMETARVFEIDTATKKILRIFKTGASWTKIMLLSPDEKKLYASNWISNNVSEIDLVTGKLIRNIKTVATPRGLYITKDGAYLYVAGYDKGEIQKIDLATGKGTVIYKTGGAMRHIVADESAPGGGVLYISDMGRASIFKLSLKDDSVTKFASTDVNPNTIALSPDKKILIVSCRGVNKSATDYYNPGPEWGSVLLFDTETGKLLDAVVGGNQPTALDIAQSGTYFAFSDFLDARIQLFALPSPEILKMGNGGRGPVYKKELKK
jgi:YVTN family beta-propeller protein